MWLRREFPEGPFEPHLGPSELTDRKTEEREPPRATVGHPWEGTREEQVPLLSLAPSQPERDLCGQGVCERAHPSPTPPSLVPAGQWAMGSCESNGKLGFEANKVEALVTTVGLLKESKVVVEFWNLYWNPPEPRW